MFFRIHRWDTEIRFVAKFGENRPFEVAEMSRGLPNKKNSRSAGLVPAPILPKMGRARSLPKIRERRHPLTCPRIPNLVRIGCVLPDLFRKD